MRTLLVEPQRIFIPVLWALLERAGFRVEQAVDSLVYAQVVRLQPQAVFIDIDFLEIDPLEAVSVLRMLLPVARIGVYTSTEERAAWHRRIIASGANAIFSKSADERELYDALRTTLETGAYTDWRILHAQ